MSPVRNRQVAGRHQFEKGWHRLREDHRGLLWEHLVPDSLRFCHLDDDIFYGRDGGGLRRAPREIRVDTFECKTDPDELAPAFVIAFRKRYPNGCDCVVMPVAGVSNKKG